VVLCRTYTEVEENNVTAAHGRHRAALDPPHPARRQRPPALRRAVPGLCLSILHALCLRIVSGGLCGGARDDNSTIWV
jgi:hypothetical protein